MEFLHVGLQVKDIQASSQFYAEMFGIKWEPIKEYESEEEDASGASVRFATLVTHGWTPNGFEIEMVQRLGPGNPAPPPEIGYGLDHIAFTVEDFDGALAEAEERGLEKTSEYRSDYADYAFFTGDVLGGTLAQLVQYKQPRYFSEDRLAEETS